MFPCAPVYLLFYLVPYPEALEPQPQADSQSNFDDMGVVHFPPEHGENRDPCAIASKMSNLTLYEAKFGHLLLIT
jgi:hypothetical protein